MFCFISYIYRMKYKIASLLFALTLSNLIYAQENRVELSLKGGNNAVYGNFAAVSMGVNTLPCKNFSLKGGLQYNFSSGLAVEARPAYCHDFSKIRLSAEALLHYRPQNGIHNVAVGCGLGIKARYLWAHLGYYHRSITAGGDSFYEPFNVYYELGLNILPSVKMCDLMLSVSNCRLFELERHYQPMFALDCMLYPFDKWGIAIGCCYKPAGIFNISSDYYQFYANVGVCYKW